MEDNSKEIRREIIVMMIPLILESFLQLLTNFVAIAMVGRLDAVDVSAQGMSTKISDLAYYVFRGIGTAMVVLIARYNARKEIGKCRYIFDKTVKSLVLLGGVSAAVFMMIPEFLLQCFTEDRALIEYAAPYLRVIACCLPFWAVMMAVTSVFQGIGDTKTPMILAAGINILNLILCWTFIFGNLGMPKLGVIGAALSLTISRAVGCAVGIVLLFHKRLGVFDYRSSSQRIEHVLREIYSIGIPAAGEAIIWQFSSILLSRMILSYGANSFAAYQLGVQAEYITEIPAIGFSVASTSLISRAVGLEDKNLFSAYKKETIRICIVISIVTMCLLMFLPGNFMQMLTNQEVLIHIGALYVFFMGLIQIPQNLIKVYAGILRSIGKKTVPVMIETAGIWGFRIPMAFLCAYVFKLPLGMIWICIVTDQIGKYLFSVFYTERTIKNVLKRW
ncbi:MAG: MATE family efflux transporter [Emergencia sp.]|nr:MATE family efflux transporter [Emergencia sp.]